jgi:uncharacterized protein YbjT (DUF2867 family)
MIVAVAGATGALGSQICTLLERRGVSVRRLARPAVDLTSATTLAGVLRGASCVVSTATSFPRDSSPGAIDRVDRDGTISLIHAAEAAAVPHFVFVSFQPVPLDFPLQRAKRAVEERLAAAALDAVVLRPAKFMDIWFSPLLGFDAAQRRATIYGDGTGPVSWIAAADVAAVAAQAALGEVTGELEFGGPEALSQRDVVRIFEQATGEGWVLEEVSAEQLEQRHALAADDVTRSLTALMLESHLGSISPPLGSTSVREFASRLP